MLCIIKVSLIKADIKTQINFRTSSKIKEEIENIAKSRGLKPSQLLNELTLSASKDAEILSSTSRLAQPGLPQEE